MDKLINQLETIVGAEHVSTAEAERSQHSKDMSAYTPHPPDVVVWPGSTADVQAIMRLANERGIPLVPWGAGTSIEGNPIPVRGGISLDFRRMAAILSLYTQDFQVTVQPGILYKDMNKTLARHGLFYAPDPGANASIGGMIANNAAGIRTVRYGATKDLVLALEVVLANGDVIRTGSRSVKQSSGYDLTHLFVGSEGTLGIVTEATLKLSPLPEHFSTVTAAFPSVTAAAEAVFGIIGSGLGPAALELLDQATVEMLNTEEAISLAATPNLFMEFHGASEVALQEELALVEEICAENGCAQFDAGIGREARARLWEGRHRLFEIALRTYPGQTFLVTDVAVPISQYPALVATAHAAMADMHLVGFMVGHAGDGNLHTIVFFAPDDAAADARGQQLNDALVGRALELGGTSTGEHGVGIGKQKYMEREHGPALGVMRQLKGLLDPKGILNPGKVLAV